MESGLFGKSFFITGVHPENSHSLLCRPQSEKVPALAGSGENCGCLSFDDAGA